MKARTFRYLEHGGLEIFEVDVPPPGPGEVQVKGEVCGICAWDLNTYKLGRAGVHPPAPAGHEGIATVVALGEGVTGLSVGDRVAGGGFATFANLRADGVYKLPAETSIPLEQWTVEPVSCVVTGIDHCQLRIGDRVAVVGCGYMGLLLVQGLTQSFANQVICFDVSPARLALAREYGADAVYNPLAAGFDEVVARVKALEIDTVVDASGAAAGFALSERLVKRNGLLNIFGWVHGPITFDGEAWHINGYRSVFSAPAARLRDPFPTAIRLIEAGQMKLDKLVTHVVTLDELASLLGSVTKGQQPDYIKGVVRL